jgi:acyl-homoserine-lactone acylase
MRDEPPIIRRSEQGPLVIDRPETAIALRVTALDRPRLFEQFWRMGLAHNLDQFQDAMRIQQLPLFNTAYADRESYHVSL